MTTIISYIAMIALCVATMAVAIWVSAQVERKPRDHLCQIAEISPDMTPDERERCRMLRMHKEGKTL